jgi:pyruvate dehydrogenase E1 component
VPHRYIVPGTNGFGRSDTPKQQHKFFEVDRHYIVMAALGALAGDKQVLDATVIEVIRKFDIDPKAPTPACS